MGTGRLMGRLRRRSSKYFGGCFGSLGNMGDRMGNYETFLEQKELTVPPTGLKNVPRLNPMLFDFQQDIVRWALRRGRAALFLDTGLGKTGCQLEWCNHISGDALILAPLAVSWQTVREGEKFGVSCAFAKDAASRTERITITNYEKLDHFDACEFEAVVLDESSILKAMDGKTRNRLIERFASAPFRLCCTATPAPNDFMELGNHSEFLGVMSYVEMLAKFFVHDGGETQKWRLKGHAESDFWKWLAQWAVSVRRPSDLGYDDGDFELPPLNLVEHKIKSDKIQEGCLFPLEAQTLQERISARRDTVDERVAECVNLVVGDDDQWLVWCNLNSESAALAKAIPDAVEVKGSDSSEHKEKSLLDFAQGKIRVLVSKASICGFGMNFQRCHKQAFVGLSDSFEQFYQAVRRSWRFGQKHPVDAHLIISEIEGAVLRNIQRKQKDADIMNEKIVSHMAEFTKREIRGTERLRDEYKREKEMTEEYELYLGDCVNVLQELGSDSIHYSIFSPPFASLYTYSNSIRDMGNTDGDDDFMEHFGYAIKELFRVLMPGRLLSFHCMNLPTSKARNGYIGIRDFRGGLIKAFEAVGFIYHSEVCIWKDPVTAMQRTKALGLLHKQLKKDSCMSRQGIPDYVVTMRKPGDNPERVTHTNESFPVQLWQRYASPIWMDINPSDTLQFRAARENSDERHICPLQLEVIRRCLELWTNPGDTVLSPFAGIGSEGYEAIKADRRFVGVELKESYFKQAVKNLNAAIQEKSSRLQQIALV